MSDSKRLQTDLVRVVDAGRLPAKSLPDRAAASAIPAAVGSARPKRAGATREAGIASPLVEADASVRTYHSPETSLTTSDGLFTIKIAHPETFTLEDGAGREVVLTLGAPP